mgnify:CR=1 FL=1
MLLRRYPIFNRRLALVAYGIDYQLSSPAEWPSLAQQCRLLAQGRQYLVPFTHEQLDELRPLLFDQDTIPLVEASADRLPGSMANTSSCGARPSWARAASLSGCMGMTLASGCPT